MIFLHVTCLFTATPLAPLVATASEWEPLAPLPDGRLNHCIAASESREELFVVGGYNFPPPVYEASLLRYDARSDAWGMGPAMSQSRDSFGCAIVGDMLYAVAGESGVYPFTLASVETLNVSSPLATWAPSAPLQQARQGHSVAAIGSMLYVSGGMAPNGTVLASVERLPLGTGGGGGATTSAAWGRVPPMIQPRYYHGLAALGSTLYAIGGLPPGLDSDPLASVEALDTFGSGGGHGEGQGWRAVAPMPQAREKMAVATGPGGRGIYVMGGCPARASAGSQPCDALLSTVLVFDPEAGFGGSAGAWSALPSLPSPNAWLGAALLGHELFVTGGGTTYGTNGTYRLQLADAP